MTALESKAIREIQELSKNSMEFHRLSGELDDIMIKHGIEDNTIRYRIRNELVSGERLEGLRKSMSTIGDWAAVLLAKNA